uniref:Phytanoyl-CoA dioxygenase n=1 Tax=viral metagenome TaxID=1070528 RepID=A0A6C0DR92_9ZZZZ
MSVGKKIVYSLIIVVLFFFTFRLFILDDYVEKDTHKYRLEEQGFQVFKNVFDEDTIREVTQLCKSENYEKVKGQIIDDKRLHKIIQSKLDENYQFQDYIWIIEKSVVHTCHRDNNGDFFNPGQKYPSYTLLLYLENMEKCLGVIPYSNKSKYSNGINIIFDEVVNLKCNAGDVIIFNSNLIHVGCINNKDDNLRLQLKITHKDDLDVLNYYQNFNKVLKTENPLPPTLRQAQRNMSCMFPIFSDLLQGENIRTARGSVEGVDVGTTQKWFSYIFYGNKDFYDLPNAF